MVEYKAMNEHEGMHYRNYWSSILVLFFIAFMTTSLIFLYWNTGYHNPLQHSPHLSEPTYNSFESANYSRLAKNKSTRISNMTSQLIKKNQTDYQLKTPTLNVLDENFRLVCYYDTPDPNQIWDNLHLFDVTTNLCTHINIGQADIQNSTLVLSSNLVRVLLEELPLVRMKNPSVKFLLWVGGADVNTAFVTMVQNHASRKLFIQSLKGILEEYLLDGVDLDWEFPSAYNKERQHLSQLLYEISMEYKRENKPYLLSVAVAAVDGIALFAYDIREINKYADYVNLMTYDYHFYARSTPFTGLNAPLYARNNERSILGTLNINYSVNWWLDNGLDRKKLVVGLPTYGHSFTLVNPTNKAIGAPAESFGRCGQKGFTTFSDVCWFRSHNPMISMFYDPESCSPYLSSGKEWISFENEISIETKARYVKSNLLGGVMVFSLNTDDFKNYCSGSSNQNETIKKFPLIETVKRALL